MPTAKEAAEKAAATAAKQSQFSAVQRTGEMLQSIIESGVGIFSTSEAAKAAKKKKEAAALAAAAKKKTSFFNPDGTRAD